MVHPSRGASHLGETASLYQAAEGVTKMVSDETARGASQIGGGAVIGMGAGLMNKVRGGLFWNSIAALHDNSRLTQSAVLLNRLIRRGAAGVVGQPSASARPSP